MTPRKCRRCAGQGRVLEAAEVITCPECGGAGTRETPLQLFTPVLDRIDSTYHDHHPTDPNGGNAA